MKLTEAAQVIRSKNAGPLQVTVDLLFTSPQAYGLAVQSPALTAESVAPLYGLDATAVTVIPYAAAQAIKIVLDRPVIAGSPGDADVYGAQQHRPLLEIEDRKS